jgi:AAA domain
VSRPSAEDHDDEFDGIGRESNDPQLPRRNGRAPLAPKKPKFQLTPFNDIKFEMTEEWLIKKLLPRKGVAAIYGASGSVKTFILLDLLLHVALGWPWARRRVVQAPTIYIAAEGAAGLRKRKIGWELAHDGLPANVPFYLIEVAPNLGAGAADLNDLIANIEAPGVRPGAIAIDTVAQSIGAGDENNTGMVLQTISGASSRRFTMSG